MTPSQDVSVAWRLHVLVQLAEHIARAVHDDLPDGDEVIATGMHLLLTRRQGDGPGRTVVTQLMSPPHDTDSVERIAEQVLDDVQDMIIGSLRRPWPESDTGLHPRAREVDGRVELGFADRDGRVRTALPTFAVPPEPDRVVDAG